MKESNFNFSVKVVHGVLPVAKTKAGFTFDPNENEWSILDGVQKFKFKYNIDSRITDAFIDSWKRVNCYYLLHLSGSHAINMHKRMWSFLNDLLEKNVWAGEEINKNHLASYYSISEVRNKGYLSSLAGYLKNGSNWVILV